MSKRLIISTSTKKLDRNENFTRSNSVETQTAFTLRSQLLKSSRSPFKSILVHPNFKTHSTMNRQLQIRETYGKFFPKFEINLEIRTCIKRIGPSVCHLSYCTTDFQKTTVKIIHENLVAFEIIFFSVCVPTMKTLCYFQA